MGFLPQGFQLDATTWFYLSLLLILTVYFRFHRLWSLRNVDLGLLLAISPGLILLQVEGYEQTGGALLATVTALLLVRLMVDALLQRRPHTTQNLNPAGLAFLCASVFVVLSLHALREPVEHETAETVEEGTALLTRTAMAEDSAKADAPAPDVGQGRTGAIVAASLLVTLDKVAPQFREKLPEVLSMVAHLAVILGLLMVGRNLFGDLQLGTAMATLYMLIPCTAISVGAFIHVLPAALIVWAIVAYRRPLLSGGLLGLACGTLVFPIFLVPTWTAFYGRRGGLRFVASLAVVTIALLSTYALTSTDPVVFWKQAITTIKLPLHALLGEDVAVSSWTEISAPHRIPIVAAYFVLLVVLTIWPKRKNIEHLIASTGILIVAAQFWYPQQVGAYLLWCLPLLLIVTFRPRIAQLSENQRRQTVADVKTSSIATKPLAPPAPTTPTNSSSALQRATLFR